MAKKYKKYKRLQFEDRKTIERMCRAGSSVIEIATEIGTHRDTIYRELRRGGLRKETYKAEIAQKAL